MLNLGREDLVCGTCQRDTDFLCNKMHVETTLSKLHSDVSLFTVTHMPCCTVCTESSQGTTNLPHVSGGGRGGNWFFSKGHLMCHLPYRHYTVCCSPVLHQSHYGGTQRSGRARLTLQYTRGLCYLEWQVGQRWKWTLTPDAWLPPPPSSNPHTSESYSTAGGLNMTRRHQGSCVQFAFPHFERCFYPKLILLNQNC